MYLSSPARMRFALGPGRAVLILGPTVRVLVGMGSSGKTVVGRSLRVGAALPKRASVRRRADYVPNKVSTGRIEASRFRKDSDEPAKAAPPNGAAGSKAGAANMRASAN